jgi:2-polyprenyl-3-methyl-5-hydroxy-6-metoxy-1,4-benzoquinol methylase
VDSETELSVEERLRQLLLYLRIDQAHFACRLARDWTGLAARSPEVISSLIVAGGSFDPRAAEPLAAKLLVVTGDQGPIAEAVSDSVNRLPGARLVRLSNYETFAWSDVAAERTDELGAAMLCFLAQINPSGARGSVLLREVDGEVAGISYRIRGAGPPLVLLPMFLAPSQWEPLVPLLSEKYCTVTLGGAALGAVAILESRGRAVGYLRMVRTLLEEAQLHPGEAVLEVGCGSGVLVRWLARRTPGTHRITGVDINPYLLREARALARRDGLEGAIEFRDGNAESLPFSDNSFDVTMSVTVIEEVDAVRMLAEMVRVTKPGGRVAIVARAIDMAFLRNLALSAGLKAKAEAPGGGIAAHGCADASLYRRMHSAGLSQVKMLPQLAVFDHSEPTILEFMQDGLLQKLSPEEATEWHAARAEAEAEGTFFMTWPHHCAVGTKPS